MAYVATNYDKNPNAPMGKWIGIDKGVPYAATKPIIFKTKDNNDKQPIDEGRPGTYYGECVSYVKAVVPELLKKQTKDWKRGAKVSPGFRKRPTHGTIPVSARHATAASALHALPNPSDTLSEPSRFLTSMDALRRGFQYMVNATHSFPHPTPTAAFPGPAILPGTAIATFTTDGRYSGHAAIYEKMDNGGIGGISVVDQWIKAPPEPVHRRLIQFKFSGGLHPTDVNDADNFYVVD